MSFNITSLAFKQGESIPEKYTCDGQNVSPPLSWSDVPQGTLSLALIMDDPDAPVGTWDHWLLFNLPPQITSLEEAIRAIPPGTVEGRNSWGKTGYGGPCPPDREHRYFFKLYALDSRLDLPRGTDKKRLEAAMQGHIKAETQLVGRYDRHR